VRRVVGLLLPAVLAFSATASGAPATQPTSRPAPTSRQYRLSKARRQIALHTRKAIQLFRAGRLIDCRTELGKILAFAPNDATTWYNLACVNSRLNNPYEAIACLTMAVTHGHTNFRHTERDPDLDAIRHLPGYKALIARQEEFQRQRAERIRARLRKRFGDGFAYEIDHDNKLVFATDVDRQTLEELRQRLTRHAEALWRDLLTHRFEQYVTVVIPKSAGGWRRGVGGYYRHGERMLVAKTVGMTTMHEFTHALHFGDQDGLGQRHPIWVVEGLATLYETAEVVDGRSAPMPNHRLNQIKLYAARGKTLPWKSLFGLSRRQFMSKSSICYAQSRYIFVYLYQKGLLKKWYDAYTAGYEKDRTGAAAMEAVFGKTLAEIESGWLAWVKAKKALPHRLRAKQAYMGIRVAGQTDGLRIVQVVAGSGADKARLLAGDVIVSIDGRRIVEGGALIRLVASSKVGDRLKVRYRRSGAYRTATVVLQPMPARLPAPRRAPERRPAPTTRPAKKAA